MSYAELLEEICVLRGIDTDASNQRGPDAVEWRGIRRAVNSALQKIWPISWWRDLTLTEQRRFCPPWDSEVGATAGAQFYHIGSDDYYVALTDTSSPPATWQTDKWVVGAHWAPLRTSQSADRWDDTEDSYDVGDQVYDEATGKIYQAHTAPTVGERPSETPAQWGLVPLFVPTISRTQNGYPAIYRFDQAWIEDPRVNPGARPIPVRIGRDGIEFFDLSTKQPWIRYLTKPHRFVGEPYDATATYTAAKPSELSGDVALPDLSSNEEIFVHVDELSDLLALPTGSERVVARVLIDTVGGEAGDYFWDVNETAAENGSTVFRPTAIPPQLPGRWIKI